MAGTNHLNEIKHKIEKYDVISFDVFDTLIKRLTNTPEDIFEIIGNHFDILDFKNIRVKCQIAASLKAEETGLPHCNYDDIYEELERVYPDLTDWAKVKEFELQLEYDSIVCNPEVYSLYEHAVNLDKRIIAVSDMYLDQKIVETYLNKCEYKKIDALYVSVNESATKYRLNLFQVVEEKESIQGKNILHIGDNFLADFEKANEAGWHGVHYIEKKIDDNIKYPLATCVDFGIMNSLCKESTDFWYNLGINVAGPLYMGVLRWMRNILAKNPKVKDLYFLSRDGYNAFQTFQPYLDVKCHYIYASRRALLLAGITELDEEAISLLPPYTFGQTVKEILDYLDCYNLLKDYITKVGFESEHSLVEENEDILSFKKMFDLAGNNFLEKCAQERHDALEYYKTTNLIEAVSEGCGILFDCGWNGTSQLSLERFLAALKLSLNTQFMYIGILNTGKSKHQLLTRRYDSFLFDHARNYRIQDELRDSIAVLELFFGAPHEAVRNFEQGEPVFEDTGVIDHFKVQLSEGIAAFLKQGFPFVDKYNIHYEIEATLAPVMRLIKKPTLEEAMIIGDVENVDSFAKSNATKKYLAKVKEDDFFNQRNFEMYWPQGFLTRTDISEDFKIKVALERNYDYGTVIAPVIEPPKEDIPLVNAPYFPKKKIEKTWREFQQKPDLYQQWIAINEREIHISRALEYSPLISVIIPVYNVETSQLEACIDSVLRQTYSNWELILIDDCSTWENVRQTLEKYGKRRDKRIHILYRSINGNISVATNDGIAISTGEFISFMDCDDIITRNALYEMAKKLNENQNYDFIYSDEDKISEDGSIRHSPFFKPDWSPDTFWSIMYTNHLAMYRAELVKKTGGLRTVYNGAQDYDFTLRFMELSDNRKVGHIPKVLYHWRERKESIASTMEAKPYALTAMKNLKKEALKRRGIRANVEFVNDTYQYRISYEPTQQPLVSIVIPSKDNYELLKQCLRAIDGFTAYPNYEIILVDNGSNEENRLKIEHLAEKYKINYLYQKMDFNFSRMCNIGARAAKGDYILLLNDDVEVFQKTWLELLVGHASQEHVGAVGVKLLYPKSDILQHQGVVNFRVGPGHVWMGFPDEPIYHFGRNRMEYNWLIVTAACLMVSKDKYFEIGGMCEELTVAYNDVDFCMNLHKKGYYNVLRNDVICYHHESFSRGSDDVDTKKQDRLLVERKYLYHRHPDLFGRDPFYNINLTTDKSNFEINPDAGRNWDVRNSTEDLKEIKPLIKLVLDHISEGEPIVLLGWGQATGKYDALFRKSLILQSENQTQYKIHCEAIIRPDLADVLGDSCTLAGFRCLIHREKLVGKGKKYKIGLLAQWGPIKRFRWFEQELEI